MSVSTTWPKNRGKKDLFDDLRDRQRLTLICGVDGCAKRWTGELGKVREKRDAHRADAHPDWSPPVRNVRGIGEKARKA